MKFLSILAALFFTSTLFAQNISGQAFYESKTTVDMDGFGGREMSEDMKKMILQRMKNYLEKTFILTFNNTASIYKEEAKLEAGAGGGGPMAMMMNSYAPGAQYKNIESNTLIEENEFFGKEFLVTDTIAKLDWKLEKESKQIGQYVAFKATAIKQVDPNDVSMMRPRRGRGGRGGNDKPKNETEQTQAQKDSINDPMNQVEIPKEVVVTAWYTPQIPVGQGPGEYAGLPGLILELNVHRTTLLCSKIIMNPKEGEKIEAPSNGKKVTREEYKKIVKEKTDEMRENFRGRGGRRGGRGGRGGF